MSRPIAYNASGPLSGSIRGGSVNYTVDSGNRDYTTFASKKWVPSADGAAPIVFVTDSYTQGFEGNPNLAVPLFYSCNGTGSAAIIYTANRVPGSPGNYTDANVALNDLITARGYFILESNDPFEGVDADSLAFDLDAAKMSSYPQVGTNWRDLSGNGRNSTLVNGPVWNSNGWIEFDGVDDRSTTSFGFLSNSESHEAWIYSKGNASTYNMFMGIILPYYGFYNGNTFLIQDSIGGSQVGYFTGTLSLNRWYHFLSTRNYNGTNTTLTTYINGTLANQSTYSGAPTQPGGTWAVGNWDVASAGANYPFYGNILGAKIYNKALTLTEVKQNYFGSPIVTDGLVFAVDANNIVSYPKSGTAWYNLTGSVGNGTLTNGPAFSQLNGGSIVFDGTDDYVNVPNGMNSLVGTNQVTFSAWVRRSSTTSYWAGIISNKINLAEGIALLINPSSKIFFQYDSTSGVYAIDGGATLETNVWYNIVGIYDNVGLKTYLNGVLNDSAADAGKSIASSGNMDIVIGAHQPISSYFPGEIANVKIYNRGLTAAEVQQNYQAEQYRFETPAGPVTNGLLLYWDAGNLDSYPGTGTTIYDLSGNGNNGNVVNGVGYNQTNGGVLTFDGVDDGVYLTSLNLSSTNNTVMGAARYTGTTPHGRMISAYNNNWLIGCWNNSTENYYAEGWVSPVQNGPNDTNWRIVTALGDVGADSYTSYINNTLSAGPNNGGSQGPYGIFISPSSEPSAGQFSFVLVYNRVLTAAEMTQNYNYFKGRFGL